MAYDPNVYIVVVHRFTDKIRVQGLFQTRRLADQWAEDHGYTAWRTLPLHYPDDTEKIRVQNVKLPPNNPKV